MKHTQSDPPPNRLAAEGIYPSRADLNKSRLIGHKITLGFCFCSHFPRKKTGQQLVAGRTPTRSTALCSKTRFLWWPEVIPLPLRCCCLASAVSALGQRGAAGPQLPSLRVSSPTGADARKPRGTSLLLRKQRTRTSDVCLRRTDACSEGVTAAQVTAARTWQENSSLFRDLAVAVELESCCLAGTGWGAAANRVWLVAGFAGVGGHMTCETAFFLLVRPAFPSGAPG